MSEFKIEVGKIVGVNGRKVMVLGLGDKNAQGEQLSKCYDYANDCICSFHPGHFREWKEEPQVGWVYETNFSNSSDESRFQIIFYNKKLSQYVGISNYGNLNRFYPNGNTLSSASNLKLKLETGRLAEEI